MALTDSTMMPLGTTAPDFNLPDVVSGKKIQLSTFASGKPCLIMFICNHCPYVIHVNPELIRLANDYIPKGVAIVAISSNDVENYPQDGPDKMKALAEELGYPFPYCYDEDQSVARAYDAACTPDFYLFDREHKLVYRGRLDESRPKNEKPLDGKDLRNALDLVLKGQDVPELQFPSAGCNIKWKE